MLRWAHAGFLAHTEWKRAAGHKPCRPTKTHESIEVEASLQHLGPTRPWRWSARVFKGRLGRKVWFGINLGSRVKAWQSVRHLHPPQGKPLRHVAHAVGYCCTNASNLLLNTPLLSHSFSPQSRKIELKPRALQTCCTDFPTLDFDPNLKNGK